MKPTDAQTRGDLTENVNEDSCNEHVKVVGLSKSKARQYRKREKNIQWAEVVRNSNCTNPPTLSWLQIQNC